MAKESKPDPVAQKNASYATSLEICKYISELRISKVSYFIYVHCTSSKFLGVPYAKEKSCFVVDTFYLQLFACNLYLHS